MTETGMDQYAELRSQVAGDVCTPGDAGFDEAVKIWNGAIDRRPAVVVRATSSADVAAALAFAQRDGLVVSVRGGGHNFAGFALCDGGLMIDLTPMKAISVDPDARRARCGGGSTWGELDEATQAHGLAVPGGFVSHTGVGGLTLGGGFGWLTRLAGLSSDNLVSAEVVTADGRVLRASETENSDLFWALRGGGGNFGVVTEFEFALQQVGPMVHLGIFLFRLDQGREMFRFAREYGRDLPDTSTPFVGGLSAPPAPFIPEELHGTPVFGLLVISVGDEADHLRLTAPITQTLEPIAQFNAPMPYVALQQMFDDANPWGMYAYQKSVFFEELTDPVIDIILEHQPKKMSPLSAVPIFMFGGAFGRADPDASAFGGSRNIKYVVNITGTALTAQDYEAERAWVRDYWSALVPHAVGNGGYLNFMSEDDEDRVRNAFGDKYERLRQIKKTYDPNNLFRLNPNIPPAP